jgi:hypothetical protein
MHKKFFLSKEVSGVHELYWHFWNSQLSHNHILFHDTYLLPLVLSLIPSLFSSATYLSSTTLENLSRFSLSSVSRCLLCIFALTSSCFIPFLLTFHALLFSCIHWTLSLHYQSLYSSLQLPFHEWRLPHLLPFPQYAS